MAEFYDSFLRAFGPTGLAAEDFIGGLLDALLGRPEVREQYQFGEMPVEPFGKFKVIKGGKAAAEKLAAREREVMLEAIDMLKDLLGIQREKVGAVRGASAKLKRRPQHFPVEREKARNELAKAFTDKEKNKELVLDFAEQITQTPMRRPFSEEAMQTYEMLLRELGFEDLLK